jgi:hypothetical protein
MALCANETQKSKNTSKIVPETRSSELRGWDRRDWIVNLVRMSFTDTLSAP